MGSSGVSLTNVTGPVTITGDLTVTGKTGLGGAVNANNTVTVTQLAAGVDGLFIRQFPGAGSPQIEIQDGGGNTLLSTITGGGVRAGCNSGTPATMLSGTGAPAVGLGVNGDFYTRTDGGALTSIYQKRAGAWVGIV